MIHYIKGDITTSNCDIICHQVNCQGAMNSGVAKAIREKWPEVYNSYKVWCDRFKNDTHGLLGLFQAVEISEERYVVNLYTQNYYGYDGTRYTDYEAFYNAISDLKIVLSTNSVDKTIAFPYKIGCVRGGANWKIIHTMIEEIFKDREIYYYYLNEKDLDDEEQLLIIATEMLKQATGVTLNEQENN